MPGDKNYRDIKHKKENFVFFLGGHDAEMLTIRDILREHNLNFHDKNLKWGAKLSDYKEELKEINEDQTAVLIELTIDIPAPKNAKIIDHHNEKENKPSSLEQIAELLDIELNRWQQLIAANDRGFIPAMECISATEEEIKKIREADRKAQGVTEEDEKLAEESIEKFKTEENGITIIKSLADKFSPITDRMYGETKRLLIYTDKELSYYGEGKKQIVEKYEELIMEGTAYHGGGDSGFFGLVKGEFAKEQIYEFKENILNMSFNGDKPISHHIFLFPFKWDVLGKNSLEETFFKDRTNLEEIFNILNENKNFADGIKWKEYNFKIRRPRDYNEYNYFYNYVTSTLFNVEKENNNTDWEKKVILQYNLELENKKSKYLINIIERKPWGKPKIPKITYELEIEDIIINFYQTGVGILSFHLSNYEHDKLEQILDINDFGRRIYPPYLNDQNRENPLQSVKETFLANSISLHLKQSENEDTKEIKDSFDNFCDVFQNKNPEEMERLPNFIKELFGKKFKEIEYRLQEGEVRISPIIDDRMFTICWYGNDHCANLLKEKQWNRELNRYEYNYEKNELWNRFIFIDNRSKGIANDNFLRNLNIEHTYSRWIEDGTFFGISRYSFILLTNRKWFPKNILFSHLQTMYFQLVMLALLQRASLLRFSDEATKVRFLEGPKKDRDLKKQLDYVEQLYEKYLHFVNKMFFREPTAQEQGIELSDMLLEKMRIDREVKDLDRELNEIHNYISFITQRKENEAIRKLTQLATFLLPPTLVAGIFGMNTLPGTSEVSNYLFDGTFYMPLIISIILMVVSIPIVFFFIKIFMKK